MDWTQLVIAALSGGVSALSTIIAIRIELRYLRRDLDKLEKRVDLFTSITGERK